MQNSWLQKEQQPQQLRMEVSAAQAVLSTPVGTQEDQHASGPGASGLLKPLLPSALSFSPFSTVN